MKITLPFILLFTSILIFGFTNKPTTSKSDLKCDLLEAYAEKPKELEFIKCESVKNSQIIHRAMYKVAGKDSKKVEKFLKEQYGMGNLKWACCGWDNAGVYGEFNHSEFKKIDPYCSAIVMMFASGEKRDTTNNSITLENDRNKIDYFMVVVELVII